MPRGNIVKNSTLRSIRIPNSDWEKIQEDSKKEKKAVAQIIRERLKTGEQEPVGVQLPLRMHVPCGEPQTMESLTSPFGEDSTTTVRGAAVNLITPGSFVGIAQGGSMEYGGIDSISNGDRLLLIPTEEVAGSIPASPSVLQWFIAVNPCE